LAVPLPLLDELELPPHGKPVQAEVLLDDPLELLLPQGKPVQLVLPPLEEPLELELLELLELEEELDPEPRESRHLPPLHTAFLGQSASVVQPLEVVPPPEQLDMARNRPREKPKGRARTAREVTFMARLRSRIGVQKEGHAGRALTLPSLGAVEFRRALPPQTPFASFRGPMVPLELRVIYGDTDQMGVVYYANYLRYFEAGRGEFLRSHGHNYLEIEASGITMPVVEAHVRYRASARYDDVIRVETTLAEIRRASLRFTYEIVRGQDAALLVEGETVHACLGPAGRPVRVPNEVVQLFGV
jgi:acyl-CoA thioester hydrolase